MKIIALEGLDKAGKHTQANLLAKYLQNKGYKVLQKEYINYQSTTGKLLMQYLRTNKQLDPFAVQLLQVANKQEDQKYFKDINNKYDYLILDRYTQSQWVYGSYFIKKNHNKGNISKKTRNTQLQLLKDLSFKEMINPWVNIYIDVDVNNSMIRHGEYGENDKYESNKDLLNYVHDNYNKYASIRDDTLFVNGMQSKQDVSNELINVLNNYQK